MRGEHPHFCTIDLRNTGSPPHARGAPGVGHQNRDRSGITPACAGSTENVSTIFNVRGDHPRMRGEHALSRGQRASRQGSPPHARGALKLPSKMRASMKDHPRMRGEHVIPIRRHDKLTGSPPHARGALQSLQFFRDHIRITPACAGSTFTSSHHQNFPEDHPRMRGEHPTIRSPF